MSEEKDPIREKLLNLPIPENGTLLDAGGQWVWVLKPITIDVWAQAKKMARMQNSNLAAMMVIDTLKLQDCPSTKSIPEHYVGLFEALEDEVNALVDIVQIEVKKN